MEDHTLTVQRQDLEKMLDVVAAAERYHQAKDKMNAATHLTPVRYSPLTTNLSLVKDRMKALLEGLRSAQAQEEEQDNGGSADADAGAGPGLQEAGGE